MQRQSRGFTLIELLTTTSIFAILASIGVPSFRHLIETQRAVAAISSLQSHMALARMAAVSRNHRTVLCPTPDGQHCTNTTDWSTGWMLFIDEDGNRQPDASDDILRIEQQPISKHLRIASTAGRQQLRYLSDGRSAGSNLTINICNQRGQLLGKVIVNNVGRPRSERYSGTAPCPF
jgi:type IV fimbrial biogenesis protein FimT